MQEDFHHELPGYPSIHMSGYATSRDLRQSRSTLGGRDEDHDTKAETVRWKFPIFLESLSGQNVENP